MASESRGDREMVAVMGENLAKDRPSRIEECDSHSFKDMTQHHDRILLMLTKISSKSRRAFTVHSIDPRFCDLRIGRST